MATWLFKRFLALPKGWRFVLYILSCYAVTGITIGVVSLAWHSAFGGERGADCRGNTCYVEGTGGDVFAWVLKSGADWSDGKAMVTRKGKRCDSACAVTAAMLDGAGRLQADPKAVYCFCHTDKARLATLTDWWDTIPPRWLKRLKTGKPFRYADVR